MLLGCLVPLQAPIRITIDLNGRGRAPNMLNHKVIAFVLLRLLGASALIVAGNAHAIQVYTPQGTNEAVFAISEGYKATYSAVISDISPATTATDVVTISGSTSKTVRVTNIRVTGDATAASTVDLYLFRRTTADTGGTSSTVTAMAHDSKDATPTAVVKKYTANPSVLGTGALVRADHYTFPAAASSGVPANFWDIPFGANNGKALVLRGAAESLAFSLNGGAVPSGTNIYVTIEWTEE